MVNILNLVTLRKKSNNNSIFTPERNKTKCLFLVLDREFVERNFTKGDNLIILPLQNWLFSIKEFCGIFLK